MTRVLVTGGTGTLGRALVATLHDEGYTVRVMSRSAAPADLPPGLEWAQADLVSGDGLAAALDGVDRVVHAATSPPNERPYLKPKAVDVGGTERLVERAEDASVDQFVYTSIVGIDEIPVFYYRYKLQAEEVVADADVPSVTLRATQFFSLLDDVFGGLRWLPVWGLPTDYEFQPIAADVVADEIATVVDERSMDPVEIGGPEVRTLGDLASAWRDERDIRRPSFRVPMPGKMAASMREGALTTPENRYGTVTWEEWLAETPLQEASTSHDGAEALVGD